MPPPLPIGHDSNFQVAVTWKELTIIWIRGSVYFGGTGHGALYCHKVIIIVIINFLQDLQDNTYIKCILLIITITLI